MFKLTYLVVTEPHAAVLGDAIDHERLHEGARYGWYQKISEVI